MSCRFQPDYRGDADFRGIAGLRTEPCLDFTFDITNGFYLPTPVTPNLVPMDGFKTLACGETIANLSLSDNSPHAFFRTSDRVTNQGYLARFFEIQLDRPGSYSIDLSNVSGFTPYITVNRSSTLQWQGVLTGGKLLFSVASNQTGPAILEVSSLNKHEKGVFDLKLSCPTLVGYWTYDDYSTGPDKLLDASGNGHNLSILSSFDIVAGKVGNCMSTFENTCETFADPNLNKFDSVGSTGFTVCGWTKFTADQVGQITIWAVDYGAFNIGLKFSIDHLLLFSSTGPDVSAPYPADGGWHFYRSWLDVDGRLKLQLDLGTVFQSSVDSYSDNPCLAFQLQGGTTAIPDVKNGFDETGFWHRPLTNAEASALWNSGNGVTWPNVPV